MALKMRVEGEDYIGGKTLFFDSKADLACAGCFKDLDGLFQVSYCPDTKKVYCRKCVSKDKYHQGVMKFDYMGQHSDLRVDKMVKTEPGEA